MLPICPPAFIYMCFSATQIIIDVYQGSHNTAVIKAIVAIIVTILLNILCKQGLGVVSWIIVFIPFVLMTVITSMLLYVFGLKATTGSVAAPPMDVVSVDQQKNIIIYDPEYQPLVHPAHYSYPNIIIPNPHANDPGAVQPTPTPTPSVYVAPVPPKGSSSPAYQS